MDNSRPIPFPQPERGLLLTDDEHRLIAEVVAPYHPGDFVRLLDRATHVPGGRLLAATDDDLYDLMEAIGVEAHGFEKVEEENAGKPLRRPRRGGNADRLLKMYRKLDDYLS